MKSLFSKTEGTIFKPHYKINIGVVDQIDEIANNEQISFPAIKYIITHRPIKVPSSANFLYVSDFVATLSLVIRKGTLDIIPCSAALNFACFTTGNDNKLANHK